MAIQRKINIEKEVKFKISPKFAKTQLESFLKKQGFVLKEQIQQRDTYWDNSTYDIINLKRGLRTRYVFDKLKSIEFKSLFLKKTGQYVVEEIQLFNNDRLDVSLLKNILVSRLEICKARDFKKTGIVSPETYLSNLGLLPVVILNNILDIVQPVNNYILFAIAAYGRLECYYYLPSVDFEIKCKQSELASKLLDKLSLCTPHNLYFLLSKVPLL